MGTKSEPGRFDCYDAAKPDEPIFILLGRDPQAPGVIRDWVIRRQRMGESGDKLMEALSCASDMEAYRMGLDNTPAPPVVDADD